MTHACPWRAHTFCPGCAHLCMVEPSASAVPTFSYGLQGTVRLRMYSFAYLAHSSPTPGGVLYTDGEVGLVPFCCTCQLESVRSLPLFR